MDNLIKLKKLSLMIVMTFTILSVFQTYSAPSLTPDDDVFKHLALTYSTNHAKMARGVSCKSSQTTFRRVRKKNYHKGVVLLLYILGNYKRSRMVPSYWRYARF